MRRGLHFLTVVIMSVAVTFSITWLWGRFEVELLRLAAHAGIHDPFATKILIYVSLLAFVGWLYFYRLESWLLDLFFPLEIGAVSAALPEGCVFYPPVPLNVFAKLPHPFQKRDGSSLDLGASSVVLHSRFVCTLPFSNRFRFRMTEDTEWSYESGFSVFPSSPTDAPGSSSEAIEEVSIVSIDDNEAQKESLGFEARRADDIGKMILEADIFTVSALAEELGQLREALYAVMLAEFKTSEIDILVPDFDTNIFLQIVNGYRVIVMRGRMTLAQNEDSSDSIGMHFDSIGFLDKAGRTPSLTRVNIGLTDANSELALISENLFLGSYCEELGVLGDLRAFQPAS